MPAHEDNREQAQLAIDRVEGRLTALQEAGVAVTSLMALLAHAHALFVAEQFAATQAFADDLLELAKRIAAGREGESGAHTRVQALVQQYPLSSEGDTMPSDDPTHDQAATEDGVSMPANQALLEQLQALEERLLAAQQDGLGALSEQVAGQFGPVFQAMTEQFMAGIQGGFQQLNQQMEAGQSLLREALESLHAPREAALSQARCASPTSSEAEPADLTADEESTVEVDVVEAVEEVEAVEAPEDAADASSPSEDAAEASPLAEEVDLEAEEAAAVAEDEDAGRGITAGRDCSRSYQRRGRRARPGSCRRVGARHGR